MWLGLFWVWVLPFTFATAEYDDKASEYEGKAYAYLTYSFCIYHVWVTDCSKDSKPWNNHTYDADFVD